MMFCARQDAVSSRRDPKASSTTPSRRQRKNPRRLQLETLEPRLALSADVSTGLDDALLTHGGGCPCPICTGKGLDQILVPQAADTVAAATTTTSTSTSLSSVPQLSSNPSARAKLYLDFNGHYQGTWGSWTNVRTPAFDQDGNTSSFSSSEIAAIREIWARVAEDYAPFQIDVTTIEPSSFADRTAVRVAVGGHYSDWFGSSAGGVAYVGAFTSAAPNIAFVFSKALGGGNARYAAEAAAHEAGHLFGLSHQSTYAGSALTQSYNTGTNTLAPIMGVGYYATRSTWYYGPTDAGYTTYQNDVSILAGANNGFGWRPDDYGDSTSAPSTLTVNSGSVNVKGVIEDKDTDVWKFTSSAGTVRFTLGVAQFGANLDAVLELKNAAGQIIASANPTTSLGGSLSASVAAGTYYLVARSTGGYGNMGQYSITGSVPGSTTTTTSGPEIGVAVSGTQIADGGSVSFGSTYVGTPISRTFTITNSGKTTLTLTRPTSAPTGFSITSNLGTTSLAPGQSTSMTVRLNATTAGTFAGRLVLVNSDANEGQYDLNLSGTVKTKTTTTSTTTTTTSTSTTKRILDNGQTGYSASGSWSTRTGIGRDSDIQSVARSTSSPTAAARWNFTGLTAGSYKVWMTWTGGSTNAYNAPISFYDGTRLVRTVTADQRTAASGLTADGSNWKYLTTLTISGSQMVVQLANNASGIVVADAVRIERVVSAAELPEQPLLAAAVPTQEPTRLSPSSVEGGEDLEVFAANVDAAFRDEPFVAGGMQADLFDDFEDAEEVAGDEALITELALVQSRIA